MHPILLDLLALSILIILAISLTRLKFFRLLFVLAIAGMLLQILNTGCSGPTQTYNKEEAARIKNTVQFNKENDMPMMDAVPWWKVTVRNQITNKCIQVMEGYADNEEEILTSMKKKYPHLCKDGYVWKAIVLT